MIVRRPLLSVLALTLLVSGCSGAQDEAPQRSAAYVQAVSAWRLSSLEPARTAAGRASFSDLVVVERRETAKESAAQNARCTFVDAAKDKVAALKPPVLRGKGTAEAAALSDELTASTRAYVDPVVAALSEVSSYCHSYAAALQVSGEVAAAEKALQRAKSKPGVVLLKTTTTSTSIATTTVTCQDQNGCLPSEAKARARYLAAYRVARITLKDKQFRVLGGLSVPCRLTDYAALCAVYAARLGTTLRFNGGYYEAVRTTKPLGDESAIDRAGKLADAETARFTQQFDTAFALAFPSVDRSIPNYDTRNQVRLLKAYEAAVVRAPVPVTTAAPPPPPD